MEASTSIDTNSSNDSFIPPPPPLNNDENSKSDTESNELLCFGYHVLSEKI